MGRSGTRFPRTDWFHARTRRNSGERRRIAAWGRIAAREDPGFDWPRRRSIDFLTERTRGNLIHEITCARPKDLLGPREGAGFDRRSSPLDLLARSFGRRPRLVVPDGSVWRLSE
jgi:hypothetical protein